MVPVNGSGEPSIPPASPSQRHKGHFARDLALHPISGSAPDQWRCTRSEEVQCLRIGCSAPINKNKRGIDRSIDATTTSKLHNGRRRVELNREISRRANPLMFGGRRATADPGCGARGRRQGLAGLRDRSLRAEGSRVAISRAGRRPRVHQAAGPSKAGLSGTRKTAWAHSNKHSNNHNNGGANHRPAPPLRPLREEPRHTLTAWRPRS